MRAAAAARCTLHPVEQDDLLAVMAAVVGVGLLMAGAWLLHPVAGLWVLGAALLAGATGYVRGGS